MHHQPRSRTHKHSHAFKFWHTWTSPQCARTNTRSHGCAATRHADHGKPSARCLSWLSAFTRSGGRGHAALATSGVAHIITRSCGRPSAAPRSSAFAQSSRARADVAALRLLVRTRSPKGTRPLKSDWPNLNKITAPRSDSHAQTFSYTRRARSSAAVPARVRPPQRASGSVILTQDAVSAKKKRRDYTRFFLRPRR